MSHPVLASRQMCGSGFCQIDGSGSILPYRSDPDPFRRTGRIRLYFALRSKFISIEYGSILTYRSDPDPFYTLRYLEVGSGFFVSFGSGSILPLVSDPDPILLEDEGPNLYPRGPSLKIVDPDPGFFYI